MSSKDIDKLIKSIETSLLLTQNKVDNLTEVLSTLNIQNGWSKKGKNDTAKVMVTNKTGFRFTVILKIIYFVYSQNTSVFNFLVEKFIIVKKWIDSC